jgi:hypothetical protein
VSPPGFTGAASWKQIAGELEAAQRAREQGNEGKARVCARRAAGWAVGRAFKGFIGESTMPNAYLLLGWLAVHEGATSELRSAARRLTAHISEDHELPHPQDPLQDARLIVESLINLS